MVGSGLGLASHASANDYERARPTKVAAQGSELRGTARLGVAFPKPSPLRSFDLAFGNRDHKIKSIGLLQEPRVVSATFQDDDGNDPFTAFADYVPVDGATALMETRGRCKKGVPCYLPIVSRPHTHFALAGFKFTRQGGDANVRTVAIDPDPGRGVVRVIYEDRWGFDFDAVVQYVLVPKGGVAESEEIATGVRRKNEATLYLSLKTPAFVLQGFQFQFTTNQLSGSTDHFLRTIAIGVYQRSGSSSHASGSGLDLNPQQESSSQDLRSQIDERRRQALADRLRRASTFLGVRFNDKNRDDPYSVTIKYLALKPQALP